MTLVQLRYLVTLADLGSFVQAAEALNLTQPALTRSIQALEDELGGSLFDRQVRPIRPTVLGEEVLRRARTIVSDTDALRQVAQSLSCGLIGSLRLGLSSAPGVLLSVPVMQYMARHHPRLQVQISRGNSALLINEIREQRLDAAVVNLRSIPTASDLHIAQIFHLQVGFLARRDHPLVLLGRPLKLQEVLAYPVASTPLSEEVARALITRYGNKANPDTMVTLRCDETLSIVELARRDDTVVLTICVAAQDLVALDISPPLEASGQFGLVTLNRRQDSPAVAIVGEQLPRWVAAHRSAAPLPQ